MKNILFAMIAAILTFTTGLASEQMREGENEKHPKGFQVISPVTLKAKTLTGYTKIKETLESFPQFATAYVCDEHNLKVNVHLPHASVMTILPQYILYIECANLQNREYRDDCFPEWVTCSHSYEMARASDCWRSNNKMTQKKIDWKTPTSEIFDSFKDIFDYVFHQNGCNGLIFGEYHTDPVCRAWLIHLLPMLVKDYGVQTLFCEIPFQLQPLFDQFFSSQDDEMPPALAACLINPDPMMAKIDQNNPAGTMVDVVKAAKKAGIKSVKAIDNIMEHIALNENSSLDRDVTMNQWGGKYYDAKVRSVFYNGLSHSTTKRYMKKCAYGLREILGLPALNIFSSKSNTSYEKEGKYFNQVPEFKEIWRKNDQPIEQLQADFEVFTNNLHCTQYDK